MRRLLPFIIAIAIGLGITVVSFLNLQKGMIKEETNVPVIVVTKNILAHETITPNDLKIINVSEDRKMPNAVVRPEEAIGKKATNNIYSGWQIDIRSLVKPEDAEDVHFVNIYIDYTRTSGAKPGDIVDVYLISKEEAVWARPAKAVLLAQNARVIDVSDSKGKSILAETSGGTILSGGSSSATNIEVVRLAIKPEEAPFIVPGATEVNKSTFALVVKNKKTPERRNTIDSMVEETTEQ